MGAPLLDNQFVGHNHLVRKLAQNLPESVDAAKDVINSLLREISTPVVNAKSLLLPK